MRRILLVVLIAASLSWAGCRRLPQRDESADTVSPPKAKGFRWDDLRDKRALRVERDLDDAQKHLDRDEDLNSLDKARL